MITQTLQSVFFTLLEEEKYRGKKNDKHKKSDP